MNQKKKEAFEPTAFKNNVKFHLHSLCIQRKQKFNRKCNLYCFEEKVDAPQSIRVFAKKVSRTPFCAVRGKVTLPKSSDLDYEKITKMKLYLGICFRKESVHFHIPNKEDKGFAAVLEQQKSLSEDDDFHCMLTSNGFFSKLGMVEMLNRITPTETLVSVDLTSPNIDALSGNDLKQKEFLLTSNVIFCFSTLSNHMNYRPFTDVLGAKNCYSLSFALFIKGEDKEMIRVSNPVGSFRLIMTHSGAKPLYSDLSLTECVDLETYKVILEHVKEAKLKEDTRKKRKPPIYLHPSQKKVAGTNEAKGIHYTTSRDIIYGNGKVNSSPFEMNRLIMHNYSRMTGIPCEITSFTRTNDLNKLNGGLNNTSAEKKQDWSNTTSVYTVHTHQDPFNGNIKEEFSKIIPNIGNGNGNRTALLSLNCVSIPADKNSKTRPQQMESYPLNAQTHTYTDGHGNVITSCGSSAPSSIGSMGSITTPIPSFPNTRPAFIPTESSRHTTTIPSSRQKNLQLTMESQYNGFVTIHSQARSGQTHIKTDKNVIHRKLFKDSLSDSNCGYMEDKQNKLPTFKELLLAIEKDDPETQSKNWSLQQQ